jgi:hypothetical protein
MSGLTNNFQMKLRFHIHGCVENLCEGARYRCGFRFALGEKPSVSLLQPFAGQEAGLLRACFHPFRNWRNGVNRSGTVLP